MAIDTKRDQRATDERRASNMRTALILLGIALVFFFGVIATRYMGGPRTGVSVLGAAVFLFLLLAIGRHLRK